MNSKKKQFRCAGLLFFASLIWGTAFVAQRIGADHLDGFTFTSLRSLIGSLVLLPLVPWAVRRGFADGSLVVVRRGSAKAAPPDGHPMPALPAGLGLARRLWGIMEIRGGICCGLALFAATNFQQFGLSMTTVGKAGFITALYVVIVPLLGLFFGKRPKPLLWVCVAVSVAGMALLCLSGEGRLSLSLGDGLVLVCAFLFAIQITVVAYFAPRCNGIALSCAQFFVCGLLSGGFALLFEHTTLQAVLAAAAPLLYVGVLSSGVAYTLQIIGQEGLHPVLASMIMCLESVISAVSGWLVLHQTMSPLEWAGCALMFSAILTATIFT